MKKQKPVATADKVKNEKITQIIMEQKSSYLAEIPLNSFLDIQDLEILMLTALSGKPIDAPPHYLQLTPDSPLKQNLFFYEWNRQRLEMLGQEAGSPGPFATLMLYNNPGTPHYSLIQQKAALEANLGDIQAFAERYIKAYMSGELFAENNEWFSFEKSLSEVVAEIKNIQDISGYRMSYRKGSKVRIYEVLMYLRQQGLIELWNPEFDFKHPVDGMSILSVRPKLLMPLEKIGEELGRISYQGFNLYPDDRVFYGTTKITNIKPKTREGRFLKALIKAQGKPIPISIYTDKLLNDRLEPTDMDNTDIKKDEPSFLNKFSRLGETIEAKLEELGIKDVDIKTNAAGCSITKKENKKSTSSKK